MIKYYNCKMERDEPRKKDSEHKHKSKEAQESESEGSNAIDEYESSFVVGSDNEDSGDYGPMVYRGDFSDEESRDKKSKKEKKKDKKKHKKHKKQKRSRRMKEDEDDFDEDDLEVIDDNDDNRLTRLKKKKVARESQQQFENDLYGENQYDDYMSDAEEGEGYSQEEGRGQQYSEEEEYSKMNEIIDQHKEIFDPFELKNLAMAEEDREILDTDLPERYFNLLKSNVRGNKKKIVQVKQSFEKEDTVVEANWIYHRMRTQGYLESFDDKDCKERIKRVLDCMHKEHFEIMYIYYYRKKIYSDYLNLDNLWKIVELDEEWHLFRERQKKAIHFLEGFLPSYTEVPPELVQMINHTYEPKYLKYFEDFQRFMAAKWTSSTEAIKTEVPFRQGGISATGAASSKGKKGKSRPKPKNRLQFIGQMVERGVIEELENSQIFLTPQNLCYNLNRRTQERKPRSPHLQPKEQFERMLGSSNPETDKDRFPLLVGENRFKTITKYLSFQLFCYPELRKLLRQKYFKKLVITTTPTSRGNQDIDIYSIYFPVKRIKEKPVSTLKRDIWMLAREAEKLGLIKLDLKFQWELTSNQRGISDRDQVYLEVIRNYYDFASNKHAEMWNLFRKRIISSLLNDYVIPSLMKEIKDDLTREGQKEIVNACCTKFRAQLNKSPSLKQGKPIKILSLVLEDTKLGVAFIDQAGKTLHTFQTIIANEQQLKDFVSSQSLKHNIKEYKPDMILIAANCKKAQTLRKELRTPDLFPQTIFCAFGEYEVPRLIAKKKITEGFIQQQAIIEAVSMARLKKNPMAEIISLWSEKLTKNGVLSMNLHPYQRFVNQASLKNSLENVIIEIVNLVGLDINDLKKNDHVQNQLQFVSGLGPRKAQLLLERLKEQNTQILNRNKISELLKGEVVSRNCTPFFKVQSSFHKSLFEKVQKQKKGHAVVEYDQLNLLDMTRIPEEWYKIVFKKLLEGNKSALLSEMRNRKQFSRLRDQNILLLELFKNPERIRSIDWKVKDNPLYDEELVKSEIMGRFRNTRDPERVMENKEIFFNLLKQTPDTLKRYMIMPVKVLSVKKNYLNVIITENGLFGYIKLQSNKSTEEYQKIYEKGTIIKAIIVGFPFDQKHFRQEQPTEQQQLLKVEMALDFPHKENADRHQNPRHDCMAVCFPSIVKSLHPNIDLDKDRFELKKEDKPVIQNRQEKQKVVLKNLKPDFRRISHPKFRNISAQPAIELMKSESNGDFIIRPSSQGPEYLVITWKFFGKVIVHIKIRCQHKGMSTMNMTYRIEDKQNRSYNSLEQIIERCIKPMNLYVQDVTSNRKFLDRTVQQIENTVKRDMSVDSSHIYYYFGVSQQYPQYFLLIYMYKDKRPIRELIKVKSSGLYFHDQQFSNVRDLITWFKEHLKEKEYQKYVKNMNIQMQKIK